MTIGLHAQAETKPNDLQLVPGKELSVGKKFDFNLDASKMFLNGIGTSTPNVFAGSSPELVLSKGGQIAKPKEPVLATAAYKNKLSLEDPFDLTIYINTPFPLNGDLPYAGIVLSSEEPGNLQNSFTMNLDRAGEPKKNVWWQTSFGAMHYEKLQEYTKRWIHSPNAGEHSENFFDGGVQYGSYKYTFTYTPANRAFKVGYMGKIQTPNPPYEKPIWTHTSPKIPDNVKEVSFGYAWFGNQKKAVPHNEIKVKDVQNDMYDVTTKVSYKNNKGQDLGKPSIINSWHSLPFSIAGDKFYNLDAPKFKGFKLRDEKREFVTKKDGAMVVTYDYVDREIPVHIIDDDKPDNKIADTKYVVTPEKRYNMTTDDAKKYIPKNYVVSSVKNASGIMYVNLQGEITSKITPVEIHVKHLKIKENATFTKNVHYKAGPGVVVSLPKSVTQKRVQYAEVDQITHEFKLLEAAKTFDAVKTPKITGYEADILNVPAEKINNSTPYQQDVTVKYYYLTKLNIPDEFNFGSVDIGSPEFFGIKPVELKKMENKLELESGNPALTKWDIAVQADSDTTSSVITINNVPIHMGELKVVYQLNNEQHDKKVVILNNDDKNKVSLKTFNGHTNAAMANTRQEYTLTWALRNVPV